MLKRLAVVLAGTAAMLATLFMAATPSHADVGDVTAVRSIPNMTYVYNGVVRSELRNGTVTFTKNTLDGAYWAVVRAEIRDRSTDGYCAKAIYHLGDDSAWGSECNAVWKPFNATLEDLSCECSQKVLVSLGRGSSTGATFAGNYITSTIYPPTGW
jgi:hypothetical protein